MTLNITMEQLVYLMECVGDRITAVRCGAEPYPPASRDALLKDLTTLRNQLKDAYQPENK